MNRISDKEKIKYLLLTYKGYEPWKGIIERWESDNGLYSDKILSSLKRQVNRKKKQDPNYPSYFGTSLELEHLFGRVSRILRDMTKPPMRPSERQEVIRRIKSNAEQLIRDLTHIGLPFGSTHYFTDGEVEARYWGVLNAIGLGELVSESESYDWDGFHEWMRNGREGEFESPPVLKMDSIKGDLEYAEYEQQNPVDLSVTEALVKLTNKKLLDSLATPADVVKTNSETYQRVFVIRKLTQYFLKAYGEGLQKTTANLCVLIFDDHSIDRETVRSALDGFHVSPEYEQASFTYLYRLSNILGHPNSEQWTAENLDRSMGGEKTLK